MVYKIAAADELMVFETNVGMQIPRGTDGTRPVNPLPGTIRYNTTSGKLEISGTSNSWDELTPGGGGGSTSVALTDLTDVNVTEDSASNGHVLTWDYDANKWVSTAPSANTGDITFEGVMIKGAGSAGEGGLGTLELVPDNTVHAAGQYLIVEPTGPNHIHLKAGNASNTVLILGNEDNHVTVDNSAKNVTISAKTGGTQYTWIFNNDGSLAFPSGGSLRVGAPPTTSSGSPGDIAGTIAFNSAYLYFCAYDYDGYTATNLVPGSNGNTSGYAISAVGTQPQVGWTVSYNNQTAVITQSVTQGNNWVIITATELIIPEGAVFGYGPGTNIWKRLVWSGDTW